MPAEFSLLAADSAFRALGVPHLDQYFGVWAVLEQPFRAAVDRVRSIDLHLHVAEQRQVHASAPAAAGERGNQYAIHGDVAVIELDGPLMKFASSLSGGTSTVLARRQLRNAAENDDVAAIVLRIDSPGGTVSGTRDLADDVAAAARRKPVHAYIEDLGASAAYWIASAASKVFSNASAIVGSIGTYAVLEDTSAAAAMAGVKVHVVSSGGVKGGGVDGAPISAETLVQWQAVVDAFTDQFVRAVASGRKLTLAQVRELADGRVHVGAAAQALGLVDGIQSFDSTLAALTKKTSRSRSIKAMSAETLAAGPDAGDAVLVTSLLDTRPQPAAYQELVTACVGADPSFICTQLAARATLPEATGAWMAEQNRRLASAKSETEQARAEAGRTGVEPLRNGKTGQAAGQGAEQSGDAVADWNAEVEAEFGKLGASTRTSTKSRMRALQNVSKRRPDLHAAMLAAVNPRIAHNQPRILDHLAEAGRR